MNIQVRVLAAQAQKQLAATRGQVQALDRAAKGTGVGALGAGLASSGKSMVAFGSQTQWTGRQLARNFTLPLVAAGAAATKFALENEQAFVRIVKVYGDGTAQMNQLAEKELPALKRAFEALSNEYGVHQKEVLQIAGDWAAAGASGVQLAKSVEITMKAMVLGEMEAAEATQALIAIQAQYGQDTDGLIKTLNILNMVENQTGISMNGLIQGMSRAAGVARSSGVDVQHLAAMMAALVPAAGSAANAGNALKTIISRVMSPTQEASQVLAEMGIVMDENAWKSKNAEQRLVFLANEYKKLGDGVTANTAALDENGNATGQMISAQQAVASTVLASRWQINRFDVLMREMTSSTGYYARALEATASEERNAAQAASELDAVLSSSPRRLKQMGIILQNSMANVIQPLLPLIIGLAASIANMARAFSNLSPITQKFVIAMLAMLALFGPVLIFFGSLVTALGVMGRVFAPLIGAVMGLGGRLLWLAKSPFMMVARGAGVMGGAVVGSLGAFGAMVSAIKGYTYAALAAGGVQGAVAMMFTRAWDFARATVIVNFIAMRLAFILTLQQMVAATAAYFGRTLAVQFGTTMLGIAVAMQTALAGMVTRWVAGWTVMYANTVASLVAMQAAVISRVGGMLIAMNASLAAQSARWTAVWAARIVAPVLAMATLMNARLLGGMVATFARLLVATAAYGAASSGLWGRMMAHLYRINTVVYLGILKAFYAFQVAMTTANVAFQGVMRAIWIAGSTAVTAVFSKTMVAMRGIFATALFNMRFLWMRFVVFLRTPALLMGMLTSLGAVMMQAVRIVRMGTLAMAAAMVSPIGLAIGAVLVTLFVFRDQITSLFNKIKDIPGSVGKSWVQTSRGLVLPWYNLVGAITGAFNRLPQGVQNAMIAVVNVVKAAAMAVYKLFSYLNPFARHSPSLVDNVKDGMAAISSEYAKGAAASGALVSKARSDLAAFRKMADAMGGGKFDDDRKDVAEANPAALGAFDNMVRILGPLNAALERSKRAMDGQEAVVKKWDHALKTANKSLDVQKDKLDVLQDKLAGLNDLYAAAEERMGKFADAPLVGMGKMEDGLFANEMAQKKLRLEMLKWESVNGNIDDTKSKLAMLQGSIEGLQGDAQDLRQAGGGSDVLGPVNAEIAKMQAEYNSLEKGMGKSPIPALQKELDKLAKQGEIMELEKSIQFDPMIREINKLANAQKEMSYDEIVAGIKKEQAELARLEPQITAATSAVKAQEAAVKQHEAARDAISDKYDIEKDKLDSLKDSYSEIEDTIRDVESALRDMGGAASAANAAKKAAAEAGGDEGYVSPGLQNFRDAAGGAFPDPGGNALIGDRGPNPIDESGLIDQFTLDSAAKLEGAIGDLSLTGPFKRAWEKVKTWFSAYIVPFFDPIRTVWDSTVGSIDWGKPFDGMFENDKVQGGADKLRVIWQQVKDGARAFVDGVKSVIALFAPDVQRIFEQIVQFGRDMIAKVGPELAKFGPLIGPFFEALKNVATIVGGILLALAKVVISVLGHTIGPIFDTVVGVISNAVQIIRGVLQVLIGIFTLDMGMALKGLSDIFGGTFGLIGRLVEGAVKIIIGIVKGLVGGIVGFFKWLYDVLVGHSIVPDLVDMIVKVFKTMLVIVKWIYDNVLKPIFDFFVSVGQTIINTVIWIKDKVLAGFQALLSIVQWIKNNILDPIWNVFKTVGQLIINAASWVKDKAIESFKGLLMIVEWIRVNVLGPIQAAFAWMWDNVLKPLGNRMIRGFANIFNTIGETIARGINVGISAVNKLIDALNWVGKSVPGLSFSIGPVGKVTWSNWNPPQFAKGGPLPSQEVGAGFKTQGARAIVGEGRKGYPEFVIPTDPRYRGRAQALLKNASDRIGGVPAFGVGGWISDKASDAYAMAKGGAEATAGAAKQMAGYVSSGASAAFKFVRKGAVMAAMAAPLKVFDTLIGQMASKPEPLKTLIMSKKNQVYNWMKGVDSVQPDYDPEGGPTAGSSTGLMPIMKAAYDYVRRTYPISTIHGFARRNIAGSNTLSDHGRGKALDFMTSNRKLGDAIASDFAFGNAHRLFGIENTIWQQAISSNGKPFRGMADRGSPTQNHRDHVHVDTYDTGGWLRPGKTMAMNNTGQHEAILTANQWASMATLAARGAMASMAPVQSAGSTTNINFYGNLEFPNITSGDDAEAFVTNLEIMARK